MRLNDHIQLLNFSLNVFLPRRKPNQKCAVGIGQNLVLKLGQTESSVIQTIKFKVLNNRIEVRLIVEREGLEGGAIGIGVKRHEAKKVEIRRVIGKRTSVRQSPMKNLVSALILNQMRFCGLNVGVQVRRMNRAVRENNEDICCDELIVFGNGVEQNALAVPRFAVKA